MLKYILWPIGAILPVVLFVFFQSYMLCEHPTKIGNKLIQVQLNAGKCQAADKTTKEFGLFFKNVQRLFE